MTESMFVLYRIPIIFRSSINYTVEYTFGHCNCLFCLLPYLYLGLHVWIQLSHIEHTCKSTGLFVSKYLLSTQILGKQTKLANNVNLYIIGWQDFNDVNLYQSTHVVCRAGKI